jgi:hypothetical protein
MAKQLRKWYGIYWLLIVKLSVRIRSKEEQSGKI